MEPVKRVRVVDSVSEKLLSAIAKGSFRDGEKLPPEQELAEALQVSRNALREAVRQLETMGVVTVRHGDGTYVSDVTSSSLVSKAIEFLQLDTKTLTDLVEARQAIEVRAAMLAAMRATPEDIEALQQLVSEMSQSLSAPREYVEKDFSFHLGISRASKNVVLMKLFRTIQDILIVQLRRIMELHGVTEQSYEYHRRIAAAVASRDPEAAAIEMDKHFANVTEPFVRRLVDCRPAGT